MLSTFTCRQLLATVLGVLAVGLTTVEASLANEAGSQRGHYFVATGGNDAWSGTLAEANAERTDGPFATLQRARNEIRKQKAPATRAGFLVGLKDVPPEEQ